MMLMQRGRMPYNAKMVARNAGELTTLAGIIPQAFEHNTSSATGLRTAALPMVWQKHSEFLQHAHQLQMRAKALETAAQGGSEADVKMAIMHTGAVCGQCHKAFRKSER